MTFEVVILCLMLVTCVSKAPCRYTGSDVRVRDDDMPFCHIALAVEGCGWTNPDNIPLMIANTMIGSWDRSMGGGANNASRLAEHVSPNGMCSSFQASLSSITRNKSLFEISSR